MKVKKSSFVLFIVSALAVFNICSCSAQKSPQLFFKNDSFYFMGLRHLNDGKLRDAERMFRQGAAKGSSWCARRSAEELLQIGNVRERVEKTVQFLKKYSDEDALLLASRIFASAEEFNKIILITNDIDVYKSSNALVAARLDALFRKNDSRFERELDFWFLGRSISADHYKFYTSTAFDYNSLVNFRMSVYRRSYVSALEKYNSYDGVFPVQEQLISDLGKTFMYAGKDFYACARKFDSFDKGLPETVRFYVLFYAARLYEKDGNYTSLASSRYKAAIECAQGLGDDEKYDNALWYLLNLNLRISTEKAVESLKQYCTKWHNPEYFDDFLNLLPPLLLSEGKWNDFYDIYQSIDGYATDEAVSKFAYIYGRLVQEDLAVPSVGEIDGSEADAAFTRALTSGSDIYYRVMAVYRLGLGGEHEEEVLDNFYTDTEMEIDYDAQTLLLGYAAFGFPEKIYPEFISLYNKGSQISTASAVKLASFLNECGSDKAEYYPQSLRIVSRAVRKTDSPVSKNDLKLLFPQNYSVLVKKYCEEFSLPEENMYALIRSESFFDSQIESFAGAAGLTQLMNGTAGDIARKLKMSSFDLKDSDTNIRFGAFYLAELYGRLDNSWLPAFFAYNAGITRVRRWVNDSKLSVRNKKNLPFDILLEMIPYDETREYGRKLVGSTAMYSWLYSGKSIMDSVGGLME